MVLEWAKMDPQSLTFTPQNNEIWRMSTAMRTLQETQQEHTERLSRLERQRDEETRVKSVWGPSSPFPGILSGTPQHGKCARMKGQRQGLLTYLHTGPVRNPSGEFANFDEDHSSSMVRSLHLDADDEPRRYGASRANSVRFDDSAKPGQWAHASRSSVDLPSRAGIGFGSGGGHSMFERSQSHKSDGKSSIGQASRANSLMLDTGSQPYTPAAEEPPSLAPGLFILGAVPSIIRCWLSDNFKHDTLLYAAICTGSYKSYLDARMVESLGLSKQVCQDLSGDRKIKLPVYLPEAVPMAASSRSSTPSSQLPSLLVDFTVIERSPRHTESKAVQIFIGSDVLRAHSADVLFSSNTVTMFDDDRTKLSIPLVRPENEETFKGLFLTTAAPTVSRYRPGLALDTRSESHSMKHVATSTPNTVIEPEPVESPSPPIAVAKSPEPVEQQNVAPTQDVDATPRPQEPPQLSRNLSETRKSVESREVPIEESPETPSASRNVSSASWGNWRRDTSSTAGASTTQADWPSRNGSGSVSFARPTRDQGIKILKPARTISRSIASPMPSSPSANGQSRFFDDGKRRTGDVDALVQTPERRSASGDSVRGMALGRDAIREVKEVTQPATMAPKTRTLNPIGGASAFGWLNSAGK
jgi:ubiquitin carboxyl-terminal hydrolase 4/11/15